MIPNVSIIVPVHNGEKIIAYCIESLLNVDYPKNNLQILIVDNNSTDSTKEIIKRYPVKYIFEAKKGSYKARNKGIKESTGDIIAFTDSDCIVDPNWLKYLMTYFDDENIGAVGGKIIANEPETLLEKYQDKNVLNQEIFSKMNPPFVATANATYKRKILEEIGLFDASFTSGGDTDIGSRIYWKGYKIKYDPRAIVYHKHRAKTSEFIKQYFRYGEGNARLFKKHKTKLGKKYFICLSEYSDIFIDLIIRLPWRLINSVKLKSKDRSYFVMEPIFHSIQTIGFKLGAIFGSMKHKVIYL